MRSGTETDDRPDSATGWYVVAAAHVVMAVTFGSAYAFSAMFLALEAEFGASRGAISTAFSVSAFIFYGLGAVSGKLADRWSTRGLVLTGLSAMTIGYLVASQVSSLGALYILYGAGIGFGIGLSYVPAISAVQSWFVAKRSSASGLATAGIGVGTLILPIVVGQIVPQVGWRGSFLLLAAIVAIAGLSAGMRIRRRNTPDTNSNFGQAGMNIALPVHRLPGFRRFYIMLILASLCVFIPYVHLVPAARDLGLPLEVGSLLVGVIGVGNVFGRFVLSGLGDRWGSQRVLVALTFLLSASFLAWYVAAGFLLLAVFAFIFGMSYGGCVGLYPAVASELFGTERIGEVLGLLYTAVGVAALIGPTAAGLFFDWTGDYRVPMVISLLTAAAAGGLAMTLNGDSEALTEGGEEI